MKPNKLSQHDFYLAVIKEIATELGYIVVEEDKKYDKNADLQIRNPKQGREAIVELETTFQRQKQQHQKYSKRYKLIKYLRKSGKDVVLLAIGIRKQYFENLFRLEKLDKEFNKNYGKFIFTCPVFDDPTWIRSALLRCLGDE